MDELSKENYDKANEHLGKIKGLVGFDKKPENYSNFLDKVESNIKQKENDLSFKTQSQIENEERQQRYREYERSGWGD